jgi:hypothetical protein
MSKAAELAALIGGQKALGHKNLVKNGAMVVAQRATSASGDTTGTVRTVDRMNPEISSAGTWTQSQSTDVPSGQGFVNSYKLDCTTADASLSAGDVLIVGYRMEGIELQRLNYGTSGAKNTVLSFWVKTNKTGNYVVQFQNIRSTIRTCSLLYTVSSANTWQKVEFPIPADTAATFDNDNLLSGILYWWLAAGTDWTSGTLNTTWADRVNANNAAGLNVNLADSTDNEWYITGIQLEEGDVATAFEHEDFGTTLAKCQRYFENIEFTNGSVVTVGQVYSSHTAAAAPLRFKVTKRAAPTVTLPPTGRNTGNINFLMASAGYVPTSDGSIAVNFISVDSCTLQASGYNTFGANGDASWVYMNGAATITVAAEL